MLSISAPQVYLSYLVQSKRAQMSIHLLPSVLTAGLLMVISVEQDVTKPSQEAGKCSSEVRNPAQAQGLPHKYVKRK